ncbi:hypothetical protein IFM89_024171 [Coptis chinensis]|uniref:Uncharacterized protein n=1 Tax=Coptis chinensis TaxID=261450 RepID=A0A835H8I5_9MAGN|nr:hypothetical protein IFM89_024171 [Coptis chinensis]
MSQLYFLRDNLPSNKFKGILLILKEMMTGIRRQHIRKQHGRAYTKHLALMYMEKLDKRKSLLLRQSRLFTTLPKSTQLNLVTLG